jgi:hypothetical protein
MIPPAMMPTRTAMLERKPFAKRAMQMMIASTTSDRTMLESGA